MATKGGDHTPLFSIRFFMLKEHFFIEEVFHRDKE
jgi:hypothetical protein